MRSRWLGVFAAASLLVIVVGCGRVDLEDLTPEAFKTEQAATQLTATVLAEEAEESGEVAGDASLGATTYETWCAGCHPEGGSERGPDILGNAYPFSEYEEMFRTGTAPGGGEHPSYQTFELTDQNLINALAYIAQQ